MRRNIKGFSITGIIIILIFISCSERKNEFLQVSGINSNICGRKTELIDTGSYFKIIYVSANSDSAYEMNGSAESPWSSIYNIFNEIQDASPQKRYAIFISQGIYIGPTIFLNEYIDLFGGFNPATWERDINKYITVLDGNKNNRIAVAVSNVRIDGFTFMNGLVRGKGGAVSCISGSPEISNNIFIQNGTLAPEHWNPQYIHETANDGGAIYCENEASPVIRNNIFTLNTTENGRGGAIAMNKKCSGLICNNVFIGNSTGLHDDFRSSDGGAVSVFDWCKPVIEHNLFIGNKALSSNDGGALFIALWSSATISNNIFVGNFSDDDAGALFIGGQEHRYNAPLDPLPPPEEFYLEVAGNVLTGNRNPTQNSGAVRFTMESRGMFANNLIAFNNGIYFQRCEAEIIHNTILDNFLLTETKEGLNQSRIMNTILIGNINLMVQPYMSNCLFNDTSAGENMITGNPGFMDDGLKIYVLGSMYDKKTFTTRIIAGENFPENVLMDRIITSGDKWSVIKENKNNEILVWDNLSDGTEFRIMPTFTPSFDSPCIDKGSKVKIENDIYGNPRPLGRGYDIGAVEVK